MAMGSYLSIITLNVNVLNAPTKRQRLAEWIQKIYSMQIETKRKQEWQYSYLIKIDFKTKAVKRDKKDTT